MTLNDIIMYIFIVIPWLAGVVLAKGPSSVFFAILFPPYAWYLVVEHAMIMIGWV